METVKINRDGHLVDSVIEYFCTCNKGTINMDIDEDKYFKRKLYKTDIDDEEICKYCGYYAVAKVDGKES